MAAPQLSQKEYLKKYLMLGNNEKKKKKKSKKTSHERFRIVDDDIDLKNMRPLDADEEVDLYNLAEDTPQIVGVIDDRPEEMRIVEEFRESKRWKVMCDELNRDSMGDCVGLSKKDMKSGKNATMDQRNSVSGFSKSSYDKGPNDTFQISNSRNHLDISSSKKQKSHGDSDASSPRRQRVHNDSDESPPRKQKRHNDSDVSPPRKRRANDGSDTSPPRRTRKHNDSDTSPRRREKTDVSPARKQRSHNDSDSSPPRHKRTDLSPSRKQRTHSNSLPRKSHAVNSSDISPTVSGRMNEFNMSRGSDDGTISSPKRYRVEVGNKSAEAHTSNSRKSKYNSRWSSPQNLKNQNKCDSSPKEKSSSYSKSRHCYTSDLAPRRRKGISQSGSSDSDNSPPRISSRSRNTSDLTDIPRTDKYEKNVLKKMEKTLDGKKAGLQDSRELEKEISDFKRREEEIFAQMNDEVSGRGAVVVMRDRKTGKRRNLEEESRQKQQEDEKMAEYKEKYSRWGKGLKQVEEQKANLEQALHEMSKPLARYADDDDLEQHLRNQEREGDPMLDYIRSKKTEDNVKSKPKYQGSFLPNRFGIPPGHRWDGVDRSNGYEKKWFEERNSRKAVEEEAYKWSTSEM